MRQPVARMSKITFRSAAIVMATIMLARAFVPIGYMLADAGDGIALYLCPEQTPEIYAWLDADPTHNGHAHHGHGGGFADSENPEDVEQSLAPVGDASCMLWANGAHASTVRIAEHDAGLIGTRDITPLAEDSRAGRRAYRTAYPRAPPA